MYGKQNCIHVYMYSTIPIHCNIKSAPASPGSSCVGPALQIFRFLCWNRSISTQPGYHHTLPLFPSCQKFNRMSALFLYLTKVFWFCLRCFYVEKNYLFGPEIENVLQKNVWLGEKKFYIEMKRISLIVVYYKNIKSSFFRSQMFQH
jgi:hypothetical protein